MNKSSRLEKDKTLKTTQGSDYAYCYDEVRSIFPLSRCHRNLILLFSRYKALYKTQKTCEFYLYCWDQVCKVNE